MTPTKEKKAILSLHNVGFAIPLGENEHWLLRNISINISEGSAILLKGPSGSGKTTLLSLMACLSRPSEGRIFYYEEEMSRWPEHHLSLFRGKTIGIVFQNFNLLTEYSVLDNLCIPHLPHLLNIKERSLKAQTLITKVGLANSIHKQVKNLSGGEKQRVAIARALMNQPQIVFADEPSSQLDSITTLEILQLFKSIKNEGKTLIVSSHDPIVCESELWDTIIVLRDGVLV